MKRSALTAVFAAAWGLFSYGQKLRVRSVSPAGDTNQFVANTRKSAYRINGFTYVGEGIE